MCWCRYLLISWFQLAGWGWISASTVPFRLSLYIVSDIFIYLFPILYLFIRDGFVIWKLLCFLAHMWRTRNVLRSQEVEHRGHLHAPLQSSLSTHQATLSQKPSFSRHLWPTLNLQCLREYISMLHIHADTTSAACSDIRRVWKRSGSIRFRVKWQQESTVPLVCAYILLRRNIQNKRARSEIEVQETQYCFAFIFPTDICRQFHV